MWVLTDPEVIANVQAAMHDKVLVIADGYHRYEISLAMRDAMRQLNSQDGDDSDCEYVMMY